MISRARASLCRTSSTTSTHSPTSSASDRTGARGRGRCSRRSPGEGRLPLRRRGWSEARCRAPRRAGSGRAHRDRQRRRRRGGAGAARVHRTSTRSLRARGAERRRAGVGASRGDVASTRVGNGVGRRGLVPARRPRPRAPPRPDASASERRAALCRDRQARDGGGRHEPHRPRHGRAAPGSSRATTPAGAFSFQEWFVGRRHEDEVDAVAFAGADEASPAPGVSRRFATPRRSCSRRATRTSRSARSSPWRRSGRRLRRVALAASPASPLIGGRAVKGPLDRMLTRMAGGTTPAHVADCYAGLIDALVVDAVDAPAEAALPLVVDRDADDGPRGRGAARRDRCPRQRHEGRGRRRDGQLRRRTRPAPRRGGVRRRIGSRDADRARAAGAELARRRRHQRGRRPVPPTSSSSPRRRTQPSSTATSCATRSGRRRCSPSPRS